MKFLASRLMLVAAFVLCFAGTPPSMSRFIGAGDILCAQAESGLNGGKSAFFKNGSCSGTAAAWVTASAAVAVMLLAGSVWIWKKIKWARNITPLGIAINAALALIGSILAGLGIISGSFSVLWSGQCYSVAYRDFF